MTSEKFVLRPTDDPAKRVEVEQAIVQTDWNAPRAHVVQNLERIGELDIAEQMVMRQATTFDQVAEPVVALLKQIDSGEPLDEKYIADLMHKYLTEFGHWRKAVFYAQNHLLHNEAVHALVELNMCYEGFLSGDVSQKDLEYIGRPDLPAEALSPYPDIVRDVQRYDALHRDKNYDQLAKEFPGFIKKAGTPVMTYEYAQKRMAPLSEDVQKKDNFLWFARKMQQCYEVCKRCPEYSVAKTDAIMTGIRSLVQRLLEKQGQ